MTRLQWNVEHLDHVDSTNSWLARRARDGAREGEVVYADFQSAGRGRLDREWVAPVGSSLLCSVLLEPAVMSDQLQLVVVAVALSMAEALERLSGVRPSLKWPNDLMYGDAKVAGVLAEVVGAQIVVGLGVNLSVVDPTYESATTVLAATGVVLSPLDVLDAYLAALSQRRGLLDSPEGCASVRREFIAHLATLGRRVRVELAGGVLRGRAVDVTETGSLLVETDDQIRVVNAGDVVHLRGEEWE